MALQGVSTMGAISGQNKASAANAEMAKEAANDQYASEAQVMIEKNRSLIQGGFDAVLAGRDGEADAYTSAIENGVSGASVKAVLRDQRQKTNRSATRTGQEMTSLRDQTKANYRHIDAQTKGRIASVPTTSFGIGDLAKIAGTGIRAEM